MDNKDLILLALDEVDRLGDVAYKAYQHRVKYHFDNEEYDLKAKSEDGAKVEMSMCKQHKWIQAIKSALA